MMPRVELVLMTEETVSAVAALAKICFTTPWSEHIYFRELDSPMAFTLTAMLDSELIGFINCGIVLNELTINSLAVAPAYRRQGIAKALWTETLRQMGDRISVCYLEVRESNAAAQQLYAALGFVQNGYRQRYYEDPPEAAILMALEL